MIKLKGPIRHKGKVFRTKREMQWAVFLDLCNADYEYKPGTFPISGDDDLPDTTYTPNFVVHNVEGRVNGNLYIHVSPSLDINEARKICIFSGYEKEGKFYCEHPIYLVGDIPAGDTIEDVTATVEDFSYNRYPGLTTEDYTPYMFNFQNIDGDHFTAHPGINNNGKFELFGDDSNYLVDRNDIATMMAINVARNVTL